MVAVPSLTSQFYLKDVQSIIAYTIRRYARQPHHTIPLLSDLIISLPWRAAENKNDPESLCRDIQSDLQKCFDRIFANERSVTAGCNYTTDGNGHYDITISVMYTQTNGDLGQVGTIIGLDKNGRLTIPEDNLDNTFV